MEFVFIRRPSASSFYWDNSPVVIIMCLFCDNFRYFCDILWYFVIFPPALPFFLRWWWFYSGDLVFFPEWGRGDETRLSGTYQRERDITPRFLFCSFVTRVCAFTRDGRLCPPGFHCLVFDSFSARWHGSPWMLLMRWVLLSLWRERHPLLEYLFCVLEFYTRSGFLGWYWFSRYGPLRPISCHSAKQRLHLFMDDLDRGDIRWTSSSGYRAEGDQEFDSGPWHHWKIFAKNP